MQYVKVQLLQCKINTKFYITNPAGQLGTRFSTIDLLVMHRLCTDYAQIMHRFCTDYAQIMQRLCTDYAQVMHRLCTAYAQIMHLSDPAL